MEKPKPIKKTHLVPDSTSPTQQNPSKSNSFSLFKSLFVVFLLVLLPLFPSQPPEFIPQTKFAKLWELLHLLFFGIAVSYGLFGRKNAEKNNEIQSRLENPQPYLSGILHISSIFEDGFENPYGFDEKITIQNRDHRENESVAVLANGSSVIGKPRSLLYQNGLDLEIPSGSNEKNVSQTWNSQCFFQGESPAFVYRENCAMLDEWGKPKSTRNLRSRISDNDTPETESVMGNRSSGSMGSCQNSDRNGKFRGLTPVNLEEKFRETLALPSPIPWRSRSSRMEVRERKSTVKSPSHSRPRSVGEFEFNHLKSESFWSPIYSQTNPIPSPNKKLSPPPSTISTEVQSSKLENLNRLSSSCWYSPQASQPPKPLPRGKSVRRIRTGEHVWKMEEICSDHVEDKEGKSCDKFEAISSMEDSKKKGGQIPDVFSLEKSSELSKHENGEIEEFAAIDPDASEKDPGREFEKFHVSSEEEGEEKKAQSETAIDSELDPGEVDRKADEFIAKFRQQIKLQRIV
ncbi:hypothetical protein U1Q18_036144 [Sarracenia purpurea var. burkii]